MLNNKKGVSAVVATVLIVMITVAAVAIIWATIIPMIKNSAEEGTKCYEAQTELTIVEGSYTCSNTTTAKVQVQRGASAEISRVEIHWIAGGDSTKVNFTTAGNLEKNGLYVYTNTTTVEQEYVTVAPVITIGNTETTCEPIQEVKLKDCS